MTKFAIVLAATWLVACSGSSPASTPGAAPANGSQCAALDGTYTIDFSQRSGNCGKVSESVASYVNGKVVGDAGAGCMGDAITSTDACTITLDQTCDLGSGLSLETKGKLTASPDGTRVSGLVELDGTQAHGSGCHSTYDVTFTRH